MFGPLYDEKHQFYNISNISMKPNQIFQKGPREKLLCDDCEQGVSRYESYASGVFFGNAATQPVRTRTGFLFTGLDYKPLKLFFMSILWRLGTTSIPQLKGAQLGPHQERVRSLLCADAPADYLTFPAMVTALTFDRRHIAGLIVPPLHGRVEGRRVWAVVVSGFLFHFFVSNRQPPQKVWGGENSGSRAGTPAKARRIAMKKLFVLPGVPDGLRQENNMNPKLRDKNRPVSRT
jgi:hypothetical protein